MGYINEVQLDGQNYLIEPLLYITAGGTSSALTAAINDFTLVTGAYVNIKVGTVGAGATLNVQSTGAKQIFYNNNAITANTLIANNIYTFLYDGNHWVVVGDIIRKDVSVDNHNLIFTSN